MQYSSWGCTIASNSVRITFFSLNLYLNVFLMNPISLLTFLTSEQFVYHYYLLLLFIIFIIIIIIIFIYLFIFITDHQQRLCSIGIHFRFDAIVTPRSLTHCTLPSFTLLIMYSYLRFFISTWLWHWCWKAFHIHQTLLRFSESLPVCVVFFCMELPNFRFSYLEGIVRWRC